MNVFVPNMDVFVQNMTIYVYNMTLFVKSKAVIVPTINACPQYYSIYAHKDWKNPFVSQIWMFLS